MKHRVRLTESQLYRIIKKCINEALGDEDTPYDMDKLKRWAKKNDYSVSDVNDNNSKQFGYNAVVKPNYGYSPDMHLNNGKFHSMDVDFPADNLNTYMSEPDNFEKYGNSNEGIRNWIINVVENSNGRDLGNSIAEAIFAYISSGDESGLNEAAYDIANELDCTEEEAMKAMTILAHNSTDYFYGDDDAFAWRD